MNVNKGLMYLPNETEHDGILVTVTKPCALRGIWPSIGL